MSMDNFFLSTCSSLEKNAVTFKLCQIYIKYLYEDCEFMFKEKKKSVTKCGNKYFILDF